MAATLVAQAVRKLWFYPRVHIGKAVHKPSYCNIKPTGHMRPRAPKSGYLKSQSSVATTVPPLAGGCKSQRHAPSPQRSAVDKASSVTPSAQSPHPQRGAVDKASSVAPSTKHPENQKTPQSLRNARILVVAPTGVDPVTVRFSVERSTN